MELKRIKDEDYEQYELLKNIDQEMNVLKRKILSIMLLFLSLLLFGCFNGISIGVEGASGYEFPGYIQTQLDGDYTGNCDNPTDFIQLFEVSYVGDDLGSKIIVVFLGQLYRQKLNITW